MMDKKLKAKWVKALRSGRYKQGLGQLQTMRSGKNCCLGVLCRIARVPFEKGGAFVPPEFARRIGLAGHQMELTDLNDGSPARSVRRHTFPQIADWIEKNL